MDQRKALKEEPWQGKKGREVFWVGNSPSTDVEVAPSMAWAENAWDKRDPRWRRPISAKAGRQGVGHGASVCNPSRSSCTSQHREGLGVIGAGSVSGCLASAPSQGLSATVAVTRTPNSPVGISHHLKGQHKCTTGSRSYRCRILTNQYGPLPPWWQGPEACHTNVPAPVP